MADSSTEEQTIPTINLGGNLPGNPESNGLAGIVGELRHSPSKLHVCVVLVDASSVKRITDTGEQQPTLRIRQIEPMLGPDADQARAMLTAARVARTGVQSLDDVEK